MITELNNVEPPIVGGRKIETNVYKTRNYRSHNSLEQMARLLLFCLECDSNNTSSKNLPSDTRKIQAQWKICKDEFEFGMLYNDLPKGSHEYAYQISIPSGTEIQRIRNVKMKRITVEIWNTARYILSMDSANSQAYVADEDADDVRKLFAATDATFARWIGSGEDAGNTGIKAPAYEELGEIRPDVDGDYAKILEPSANVPSPKLDDAADTDV
jgi:hypothetical protein